MNLERAKEQLNYIWNSSELIQAGMNTEYLFDAYLSGFELNIDNIIIRTDLAINFLIGKNPHNINSLTDYFSFIALGIRYMSQFGKIDNSNLTFAKFGNSFDNLVWPSVFPFSKEDILITFTRSVENSFNISLLDSHYTSPLSLN